MLSRRGSASTAVRSSFCNVTSRSLTERRIHPACPSRACNRTTVLVVVSVKTATAPAGPVTVPKSTSDGGGGADGGGFRDGGRGATAATIAGAGGRRDDENSGRSRVARSDDSGTAQ